MHFNKRLTLTYLFAAAISLTTLPLAASNTCDLGADKCNGKPLSKEQMDKSLFLGDQINQELENLYEKYKAEGKELSAVIIAREGSNVDKFKILDDQDGQISMQQMVADLQNETMQMQMSNEGSVQAGGIDYNVLRSKISKTDKLKFSHLGIAFRNLRIQSKDNKQITGPEVGQWAFYHLLYSCEKPEFLPDSGEYIKRSHIFKGTVHSFFWDHLEGYNAQLIIPTESIQKRLERILVDEVRVNAFKHNQYNAAAKFNDLTQQNSNQFVLEAVAAALDTSRIVNSRQEAIEVLTQTNYSASKLVPTGLMSVTTIPFVQKIISNMMPTMCFKSQPELKKHGIGEIITSNSVLNWMKRNQLVENVFEIGLGKDLIKEIESHHKSENKDAGSVRP